MTVGRQYQDPDQFRADKRKAGSADCILATSFQRNFSLAADAIPLANRPVLPPRNSRLHRLPIAASQPFDASRFTSKLTVAPPCRNFGSFAIRRNPPRLVAGREMRR